MKIYLEDKKDKFPAYLEQMKQFPVKQYNIHKLPEKITCLPFPDEYTGAALNADFLFQYQVFPTNILTYYGEWQHYQRLMQAGDTVVQQVNMPPWSGFSFKLIFGVRVHEVIDLPECKGFSYETLEGHIETGLSLFVIEKVSARWQTRIQTWSETGNILARITAPLFASPYQAWCTRAALSNIRLQCITAQ